MDICPALGIEIDDRTCQEARRSAIGWRAELCAGCGRGVMIHLGELPELARHPAPEDLPDMTPEPPRAESGPEPASNPRGRPKDRVGELRQEFDALPRQGKDFDPALCLRLVRALLDRDRERGRVPVATVLRAYDKRAGELGLDALHAGSLPRRLRRLGLSVPKTRYDGQICVTDTKTTRAAIERHLGQVQEQREAA